MVDSDPRRSGMLKSAATIVRRNRHRCHWLATTMCRRRGYMAVVFVVGLSAPAMVACGGKTGGQKDGSGDAAPVGDGGQWGQTAGMWSPVCPRTQPSFGSSCNGLVVYCEYGNAWWDVSCDTVVVCGGGVWQQAVASHGTCFAEPGPNSSACPTNPLSVGLGSSCADVELSCYYGQGAMCECTVPIEDAGAVWGCSPQPVCPGTRPRIGSYCDTESFAVCGYGGASGVLLQCKNGIWQPSTQTGGG
jgi:hypothetical protein